MGLRDSLGSLSRGVIGAAAAAASEWAEGPSLVGESLEKAAGAGRDEQASGIPTEKDKDLPDPQSMFFDPFAIIEQLGYKERPTPITYGTLRAMVYKMPIIHAVIQTRINQVAAFAQPQRDRYDLGFRVTMRDEQTKPKGADKKWIHSMEDLLMHTGVWGDPRHRDGFEPFLRKIAGDSLIFDQATFEIVPNRKGAPAQWYAVDAASIRLADTATAYMKKKIRDDTMYVQIYDGMVVNEYNDSELCFGVRNPKTDIRLYGYGTSELEILTSTITSLLWAWQYNSRFFSSGSATKGILNFKGAIPEHQLKGFRRHWYNMLTGVANAWRTPVTNAEGLEWIDLHANNRDMEFNAWMDFLIKVACFTPEAQTMMADGSRRRMDEVQPGDMVMTHMGRSRKVKNVQVTEHDGELICFRAGGEVTKATPEHPFYATASKVNSWMRRDFEDPSWVEAKDLVTAEDYLVVPKPQLPTDVTSINLRDYLELGEYRDRGDGYLTGNSNRSNAVPAVIELTPNNAFVLGLYVAEGCSVKSTNSWSFHEDELAYQDATWSFLQQLGMNPAVVPMPEKHCTQVRGASPVIVRAFRRMFGHKAPNKVVPQPIMEASSAVKWAFLSGLIGGDGCVPATKRGRVVVELATSSSQLAVQVKTLFLSLGVWANTYEYTRPSGFATEGTMTSVRVHGTYLEQIARYLSGEKGDRLRQYMERCRDKEGQGTGPKSRAYETPAYFYIPIAEMWREPYKGKVYNLEVEGDHTYTIHGAAVHNCSVYSMDPVEVNFKYGNTGQKSAMQDSHNQDKITESKERGLRPLLRAIAAMINQYIIWPSDENFKFEFVGLDSKTHSEVADLHAKQVKTTRTVDELRAEDDLPPLPDGLGKVILDPTWMQMYNQKQAAEMGAVPGQEGGPPGMPDAEEKKPGEEEEEEGEKEEEFDFQALLSEEDEDEVEDNVSKSLDRVRSRMSRHREGFTRHSHPYGRNVSISLEM